MRTDTRSFMPWILAFVFLAGPVLAAIPHTSWLMSRMAHKREKLGVKRAAGAGCCAAKETP